MRPVTEEIYGIPAERVIGSSNALSYQEDEHGGTLVYLAKPDVFDDGPAKPVRIWSRIGRRPILAGGNSNGDIPMLHYAGGRSRKGCACWSSTTTPSASSTTRPAPRRRLSERPTTAGPWSASRTTGRPSSPTPAPNPASAVDWATVSTHHS